MVVCSELVSTRNDLWWKTSLGVAESWWTGIGQSDTFGRGHSALLPDDAKGGMTHDSRTKRGLLACTCAMEKKLWRSSHVDVLGRYSSNRTVQRLGGKCAYMLVQSFSEMCGGRRDIFQGFSIVTVSRKCRTMCASLSDKNGTATFVTSKCSLSATVRISSC